MGRKPKEKPEVFDRLGEEVNLEKCPMCPEGQTHTDCFSYLEGRCTALNVNDGQSCSFYKPAEKAINEYRAAYQRLKAAGRYDLIQKYVKAFTAMGFLDEDIEAECNEVGSIETDSIAAENRRMRDPDACRDSDFKSLMSQIPALS